MKKHGNHITSLLSISDLIQLGGYTAVEYCGGPAMVFRMGRKDTLTESSDSTSLATQSESHENSLQVAKFNSMNLSPQEYVALMGSYTLGFANDENKTKNGRWCMNPYVFDNTYFQEVLLGASSKYLKTEADLALLADSSHRVWVEKYAEDQNLFFESYASAHVKVSEMGQESNLVSEFNDEDMIDGGFQENQGRHWSEKYRSTEVA